MPVGRDYLFMRKSTLFTEQVHFYACKMQSRIFSQATEVLGITIITGASQIKG